MQVQNPDNKQMARRCGNSPDREPADGGPMTIPIVTLLDSEGNPVSTDMDVLAWADALCGARDEIERAFLREEEASIAFHHALYVHFEHCLTLADVDNSQRAFAALMARWLHQQDIDTSIMENFAARARKRVLRAMPYDEYLRTDHWQGKRREAIKSAHKRCQLCNQGNRVLHVHHRTYDRRGCEDPADLIVLCDDCHRTFHEHGKLAS